MNWYKKAQFTERLDKRLMEELNQFNNDVDTSSTDFMDQWILPTDEDIEYLANSYVAKRGVILTPEQYEILKEKIRLKIEKDGYRNRGIRQSIQEGLGDLDIFGRH